MQHPLSPILKSTEKILTPEALQYYLGRSEASSGALAFPFYNYLPFNIIQRAADVLRRPLSLQDMTHVISADGEITTCSICRKQFQPVRWIVLNKYTQGQLQHFNKVVPESMHYAGCYLIVGNKKMFEVSAFCGTPRRFIKTTCSWDIPRESHLVAAAQALINGDWGLDLTGAKTKLERLRAGSGKVEPVHEQRHHGTSGLGARRASKTRDKH